MDAPLKKVVVLALLVAACNAAPPPSPTVAPATRTPSAAPSVLGPTPATPTPTPATTLAASPLTDPSTTPSSSPEPTATLEPTATPVAVPPYMLANCRSKLPAGWSIARYWDEQALNLVRVNPPAPTVVARNLFHLSAAMWDAWSAYDPVAVGYFLNDKQTAADVATARDAAISFAAFRLLLERYFGRQSPEYGLDFIPPEFAVVMEDVCYRADYNVPDDSSPAGLGIQIANAAIKAGREDGSLESDDYVDGSFTPVNDPMKPFRPGTAMNDPNKWQPLEFPRGQAEGQGGRPAPDRQTFVAAQWGAVKAFALPASANGVPIDPGQPPALGADSALDEAYKQSALDILRYSSTLDPEDGFTEDISPGAMGNNDLGTNDGEGRSTNPVTAEPYASDVVLQADYERALAEYWADGPSSETPPGHWNLIANAVADSPRFEFRMGGGAPIADRLEWDVKAYFALNGALHDSAIAAWGLKRYYDTARPISMIRYMCALGQSSDPAQPHYDAEGIPLVPGLVELITAESAAPGERHAALSDHIGEIAVHSWRGFPKDPTKETSGVGWILGIDWVPYQRAGFVTPAFPGYVSGHSTYSRAAAEVMTSLTGTPFFPGGLYSVTREAGTLRHEVGPTKDVTFQWATYYDAADAAGISRLFMGIHIPADDFEGRKIGSQVGTGAWALAEKYFDGSATR